MSQWTHIRGGLELVSTPYEIRKKPKSLIEPKREDFKTQEEYEKADDIYRYKLSKLLYFPYPEEQFKLEMPKLGTSYGRKKKNGKREEYQTLEFSANIYSLPRARKYIEEAFNLMPQGESGFRYSLDQNATDYCSSSSGFTEPCEYKAYKNALNKLYKSERPWESYTYEDLRRWFHIQEDCHITSINHILVGIRDDIRCCSAKDVQEGLEKVFAYLKAHDIIVGDGYLEWQDEYDPEHLYAWRYSRLSFGISHQFLTLDIKCNSSF